MVVGMVRRGWVVVGMVRGMALAGALMEGVRVVGGGVVEVAVRVAVGCVVVVVACEVVVVWVVALRWVAGGYSGSGLGGRCRVGVWLGVCGLVVVVWAGVVREVSGSGVGRGRRGGFGSGSEDSW